MAKFSLRGFIFISVCCFTAFFASIYLFFPTFLFLFLVDLNLCSYLLDIIAGLWYAVPFTILHMGGVKLRVYADPDSLKKLPSDNAILLFNHPTTADWLFAWPLLFRFGRLTNLKIAMKSQLKVTPLIGWCLQFCCHLFLDRSWDKDRQHIQRILNYFTFQVHPEKQDISVAKLAHPIHLLIFPEGTDFRPDSKAKSDSFAQKQQPPLPLLSKTLWPRSTGFLHLFQLWKQLANESKKDPYESLAVYDVTIGYNSQTFHEFTDLVTGDWPQTISFLIHRRNYSDLLLENNKKLDTAAEQSPAQSKHLEDWLRRRWLIKEQQLHYLEKHGTYDLELAKQHEDGKEERHEGEKSNETNAKQPNVQEIIVPQEVSSFWVVKQQAIFFGWLLFSIAGLFWWMSGGFWVQAYSWFALMATVALGFLGGAEKLFLLSQLERLQKRSLSSKKQK